jgi:hypothetical protein
MFTVFVYTLIGAFCILFIDVVGAIASRKLKFEFGYLSFISFTIYVLLGYFVTIAGNLNLALLAALFVGFIDATVGWKLSKLCKAHTALNKEELSKMTAAMNLKVMLFIAPVFAFIGYLFT